MIRRLLIAMLTLVLLLVATLAGFAAWYVWATAEVGAAYGAKVMASGIFVAGRTPESLAAAEVAFIPFLKYEVDETERTVTVWTLGGHRKTAVYREGLGAAIAHDGDFEALRAQARPDLIPDLARLAAMPWPMGDAPTGRPRPAGIDEGALEEALDRAFAENNRWYPKRVRALIVVHDGEIVAERYGEGFGPDSRLAGWSVTKSVLHALYGIAVRDGMIDLSDTPRFWQDLDDPRSEVTIDMLLRMTSGSSYNEFDMLPPADLTTMIFLRPDAGAYAASLPLSHPPDTRWAYSSGTSNILSRVLRDAYGDDAYYALPYTELFAKLGMRGAMIEADPSGAFVMSSLMWATARDYARFGLLYLNDGVWEGERILPEGWVDYGRAQSAIDHPGPQGAHWWLYSGGPADSYHASGFEGQAVVVIPSRRTVIVRLGMQHFSPFHPGSLVRDILAALPAPTDDAS